MLLLALTHKHLLYSFPSYFFSCTVIMRWSLSSIPRNHRTSIYHMWAALSFKKKNSLPSGLGRTLLLNHLMVTQWSAIFRLAGWLCSSRPLPSDVCTKASVTTCCYCLRFQFIHPTSSCKFWGTVSVHVQVDECWLVQQSNKCAQGVNRKPKGRWGEDVFMCVKKQISSTQGW